MLCAFFQSRFLCQAAVLAAASCLYFFLRISPFPTIDLNTYAAAAHRIFSHADPYAAPEAQFHHFNQLPFLAVAFQGVTWTAKLFPQPLPITTIFLWVALGTFVFWYGILRWVDLREKLPRFGFLLLLLSFLEVDYSLQFYQINALIAGLTLLSLDLIRRNHSFLGGFLLMLVSGLKIYPALFAPFLLISSPRKKESLAGILAGAGVVFLAPAVVAGWNANLDFHGAWWGFFWADRAAVGADLRSVLTGFGFPSLANALAFLSAGVSLALLARTSQHREWRLFLSLGLSCILILSPKSANPTFVLLAPCFLLLTLERCTFSQRAWLLGSAILVRSGSWHPLGDTAPHLAFLKSFGAFGVWLLCCRLILSKVLTESGEARESLKPKVFSWASEAIV